MKKDAHITAFYLETLMLIVVFIAVILILTNIFTLGRVQSARARELNCAVHLAQNAAEAVSTSDSADELLSLLNENSNAYLMPDTLGVTAFYGADMEPDINGGYRLDVTWLPRDGGLVKSVIELRFGDAAEPIYTLETAVYLKEAAA